MFFALSQLSTGILLAHDAQNVLVSQYVICALLLILERTADLY